MESDHSLRSSLGQPESCSNDSGTSEPQAVSKSLRRRPGGTKSDTLEGIDH
jgi:hypothetical protein